LSHRKFQACNEIAAFARGLNQSPSSGGVRAQLYNKYYYLYQDMAACGIDWWNQLIRDCGFRNRGSR
jgi:hypothetical protein